MDSESSVAFIVGFAIAAILFGFGGFFRGEFVGYADGCRDGSRGHSQVVTVEGKRRCVPHPEALKMRGK